jgi:hypothetical protein
MSSDGHKPDFVGETYKCDKMVVAGSWHEPALARTTCPVHAEIHTSKLIYNLREQPTGPCIPYFTPVLHLPHPRRLRPPGRLSQAVAGGWQVAGTAWRRPR